NAGIVVPSIVTAFWKSSSLTDGSTRRLITPRERTVGTKASSTPNFLNSIVTVGKAPATGVEATGTGNSPPARKRAASPDRAIRFGSASRRNRPLVSRAVTSRSTEAPFRSEEHTSELQSRSDLVCRLLLEKKK